MVLSAFTLSVAGEGEGDSVTITGIFQAPVITHSHTSKRPLPQFTRAVLRGRERAYVTKTLGLLVEFRCCSFTTYLTRSDIVVGM